MAALVAWLFASGVSADLLQVVAYADHVTRGIHVAAKDHCAPCEIAESARDAAERSPVAKSEAIKLKAKADGAVWSVRLSADRTVSGSVFREVTVPAFCPELICEVPVPPPRGVV